MPHAHLTVYHLLQQLETRRERALRDRRPKWLAEMIDAAAVFFEPVEGVGRVGFECWPAREGWIVDLYLGSEEQVGGASDGMARPMNFRFNLLGLMDLFDEVFEAVFDASAMDSASDAARRPGGERIQTTVRGRVGEHSLTLHVHATPPTDASPAFRRYANGRREIND